MNREFLLSSEQFCVKLNETKRRKCFYFVWRTILIFLEGGVSWLLCAKPGLGKNQFL